MQTCKSRNCPVWLILLYEYAFVVTTEVRNKLSLHRSNLTRCQHCHTLRVTAIHTNTTD